MRAMSEPDSAESVREAEARTRRDRLGLLLKAAQEGSREGLGQIIEELTPLLWRVARAQGLSTQDAEDAVQAGWLALLKNLGELRDPGALTSWLLVVVKRESWRVRAAGSRERSVEAATLSDLIDPSAAPEEAVLEDERRRAIRLALSRLPERCQQLMRVVAFAHRPDYDAVAAALGMPRGSIGPTRGRCLAKLRALLDADPSWAVPS
jgi:RNA polymerase sigma factor (sigma-70 family)